MPPDRLTSEDANPDEILARAWLAISRSPQRPWTLREICSKTGCSQRRLHDWALRSFGRPPMCQILHLRLVRAAQLLLSSRTEEDAARLTGFGNVDAFRIAFLRWSGQTPDDYCHRPAWNASRTARH